MEGYKNIKKYIDSNYPKKGARVLEKRGNIAGLFAFYSSLCEHGINIDTKMIEAIYIMEILKLVYQTLECT